MKDRIALGTVLLLTLGTAVAGTFLYGQEVSSRVQTNAPALNDTVVMEEVSADTIAAWKATALATDYVPPKVPI